MKTPASRRGEPGGFATERISLTSAAACLGILVWVMVNAYLSHA